jgi:archaellum component FlaC
MEELVSTVLLFLKQAPVQAWPVAFLVIGGYGILKYISPAIVKVPKLESDIKDLEVKVEQLSQSINTSTASVESLREDISEIKADIRHLLSIIIKSGNPPQ